MSPPIASWLLSATSGAHRGTSPLKPAPRCSALVEGRSLPPHRSPRLFEAGDRNLDPTSSFFLDEPVQFRLQTQTVLDAYRHQGVTRGPHAPGRRLEILTPLSMISRQPYGRFILWVYLWEFHRLFSVRLFFNEIMRMRADEEGTLERLKALRRAVDDPAQNL
jgi:hypothetical protein